MAQTAVAESLPVPEARASAPARGGSYLDAGAWLTTLDHKRIALMYLASVLVAFALGGVLAGLVRLKMLFPGAALVAPEDYLRMATLHGVLMGFAFVVPAIPGVLGNFLVPLMVGAKGLAWPKLARAGLYVYWAGALLVLVSMASGGADTGWELLPPGSTTSAGPVGVTALGVFVMGFAGVLNAMSLLGTVRGVRAPGQTSSRLPIFVWALGVWCALQIVATPALGSAMLVLVADRALGLGQFDFAKGGSPLVFQQYFWFYGHSAIYLALLPAVGVVSEIVAVHARRAFGHRAIVASVVASAALGLASFGQHLTVSGQGSGATAIFGVLALLAAVPSAVLVMSWLASLWRGSIALTVPMLWALGFVALYTLTTLAGLFLGMLSPGAQLAATYFELAHLHYLAVGGALMAFVAGLFHWWPKMTGRECSEGLGRLAWALTMVGVNATFFVQFVLGSRGLPRHHYAYDPALRLLQGFSTVGSWILAAGLLATLATFIASLRAGKPAAANPWGGATMEWQTASPPPSENFESAPEAKHGPYDFAAALELPVGKA